MPHPPLTFGEVIGHRGRIAESIGLQESDLVPDVPLQVASTGVEFLYMALKDRHAVDSAVSDKLQMRKANDGREALPIFLFVADLANPLYRPMLAPDITTVNEDP